MSDIEEKYNNCPKHIQEVVDLLLEWYVNNNEYNENDNTDVELLNKNETTSDIVTKRFVINVSNLYNDVKKTRIIRLVLDNEHITLEKDKVHNWTLYIKKIAEILDMKNPNKMVELSNKKWTFLPNGKREPVTDYVTKEQVDEGIYVRLKKSKMYFCTNYDNNGKVQLLYALIKEFGYNEDALTIEVEKLENSDLKNE